MGDRIAVENKKHWWQEEPLRSAQCNLGDDPEWVLDEYVSKQGFNTEQLLHLTASLSSVRGAELKNVRADGNKISFTLDNVREHEIIMIE